MKQKLKAIAGGIAIIMLLFLNSCEKDTYDDNTSNGKVKMTKVTLKDPNVLANHNLMQEVQKIKLKQGKRSFNNKMIYDSINDFYFDDENGVLIEKDNGYKSYTFPIYRNEQKAELENIVFSLNANNEYDAYLAKYSLSSSEIEKINNEEAINLEDVKDDIVLTDLSQKVTDLNCWKICSSPASYNSQGQVTSSYFWLEQITCPGGGSGGGGGGASTGESSSEGSSSSGGTGIGLGSIPGSNSTSGQNDATNGSGGVSTTPVGGGATSGANSANNPCSKLAAKTNTSGYTAKFNSLNKSSSFNLRYETGFVENKINGVTNYSTVPPNGNTHLTIPNNSIGFTHVHNNNIKKDSDGEDYDETIKMLSPEDLAQLITTGATAATAAGMSPLDAYGVMISNEGIFSLVILDANIDLVQVNNKWKNFEKNYNIKAKDIIRDLYLSQLERSEKLQEMMLKLLEDLGLKDKVGLFEGDVELGVGSKPNKIQWTRKGLDSNKKVIAINC